MELEIDKAKLWEVARKYNEKAKELSLIVRDFWDLYDHLEGDRYYEDGRRWGFGSGISCDDFHNGSLNKITFLRLGNENPRTYNWNNKYLFDLYRYRSSERKRSAIKKQR